jgi:hypothetical protein
MEFRHLVSLENSETSYHPEEDPVIDARVILVPIHQKALYTKYVCVLNIVICSIHLYCAGKGDLNSCIVGLLSGF